MGGGKSRYHTKKDNNRHEVSEEFHSRIKLGNLPYLRRLILETRQRNPDHLSNFCSSALHRAHNSDPRETPRVYFEMMQDSEDDKEMVALATSVARSKMRIRRAPLKAPLTILQNSQLANEVFLLRRGFLAILISSYGYEMSARPMKLSRLAETAVS